MEVFVGLHILLPDLYVTICEHEYKVMPRYKFILVNMITKYL